MPRTKIIATIGPASRSDERLEQLVAAGMDIARLNFSHGTGEEHAGTIERIRSLAKRLNRPVAILQDLAGLKIRTGEVAGGAVTLTPGASFTVTTRDITGDASAVSVGRATLPQEVAAGDTVLLADGALDLKVESVRGTDIVCRVVTGGILGSRKGLNIPGRSLGGSGLTPKDRDDLLFGIQRGVDFVALSFVRKAADVHEARKLIENAGGDAPLIAKIENQEALDNIGEILEAVDGIMVARGDLGVWTPIARVPLVQKSLIEKCNHAGKPVITATHMLRSMVDKPRPTRAEVTDVANSVLDGTDAVMLSEETAVGAYPVEAVRTMAEVAAQIETSLPHDLWMIRMQKSAGRTVSQAMASAVVRIAQDVGAAAIVTGTSTGSTARAVARFRPRHPVLALTSRETTYRRLTLTWGVTPCLIPRAEATDDLIREAVKAAREVLGVRAGDRVVITAGVPAGIPGSTNLIKVEEVRNHP